MATQHLSTHLRGIRATGWRAGGEACWTWNPARPPIVWVTLAEVPDFPVPQFPHEEKEDKSALQCCCDKYHSESDHVRAQSRTLDLRENKQVSSTLSLHVHKVPQVKATEFHPLLLSPRLCLSRLTTASQA